MKKNLSTVLAAGAAMVAGYPYAPLGSRGGI